MWAIDSGFFTHNGLRVDVVPQSLTVKELDEVLNEMDIIEAAQTKAKDLTANAKQMEYDLDYLVSRGAALDLWKPVQERIQALTADAKQLEDCAKYLGCKIDN